ncbi:CheY-like superfamily [Xylariales sp. PMI_506]|nr:CheY-like superfamily [Xylariales sp. PMI_506]
MLDIGEPTTPQSASLMTSGLLPSPGFSAIAIPIPNGSLYLNSSTGATTTLPSSTLSVGRHHYRTEVRPALTLPENAARSAYTLLIVDDNPVQRMILHRICNQWGQPNETAENGLEAVEMYKRDPDRFRCILMDTVMPVMDGFEATAQIRAFEEASWESSRLPLGDSSRTNPIRRAVIIALVPYLSITNLQQRIVNTGFDLSLAKPIRRIVLAELLFTGPSVNIVCLHGGVEESELRDAGYPLERRRPSLETRERYCRENVPENRPFTPEGSEQGWSFGESLGEVLGRVVIHPEG